MIKAYYLFTGKLLSFGSSPGPSGRERGAV
jgi:hypothetical protein